MHVYCAHFLTVFLPESSSGEGAWAMLPQLAGLSLVWTCLSCVAWALSQEASPRL